MIEKISNTGFYSILLTVLVTVFCFGFIVPAFNNFTYDANYSYVVEVYKKLETNKKEYRNNWEFSKDKKNIKFNNISTFSSDKGYPTIDISKNKNEIITGCQDIWVSLTNVYAEIGDFNNIKEKSIFFVEYDSLRNNCQFIYVDLNHVNTDLSTHIITYNLNNGDTSLFKNKFNFNIGSNNV